jgi:hypothetical protein
MSVSIYINDDPSHCNSSFRMYWYVLLKMVAPTQTCQGWNIKKRGKISITLDGVSNPLYWIWDWAYCLLHAGLLLGLLPDNEDRGDTFVPKRRLTFKGLRRYIQEDISLKISEGFCIFVNLRILGGTTSESWRGVIRRISSLWTRCISSDIELLRRSF